MLHRFVVDDPSYLISLLRFFQAIALRIACLCLRICPACEELLACCTMQKLLLRAEQELCNDVLRNGLKRANRS
jgi:hypothetical protein